MQHLLIYWFNPTPETHMHEPLMARVTPGSSWRYSKSQLSSDLSTFSDKYTQKWLQDCANGSKNALGIPSVEKLTDLDLFR